jgi:hypothetical protein
MNVTRNVKAMNVTRDVVTDLLPVYFSGEASEDTKRLMEDYFRENPDFERIARGAARPLETLRAAPPVAADAEKEKRDLQWVREELFRRRLMFGLALVFTFAPLIPVYSQGHWDWMTIRSALWLAVSFWSFAALFWAAYLIRLRRRTLALVWAIFTTFFPLVFTFHLFLPGWQIGSSGTWGAAAVMWFFAIALWIQFIRLRPQK